MSPPPLSDSDVVFVVLISETRGNSLLALDQQVWAKEGTTAVVRSYRQVYPRVVSQRRPGMLGFRTHVMIDFRLSICSTTLDALLFVERSERPASFVRPVLRHGAIPIRSGAVQVTTGPTTLCASVSSENKIRCVVPRTVAMQQAGSPRLGGLATGRNRRRHRTSARTRTCLGLCGRRDLVVALGRALCPQAALVRRAPGGGGAWEPWGYSLAL